MTNVRNISYAHDVHVQESLGSFGGELQFHRFALQKIVAAAYPGGRAYRDDQRIYVVTRAQ